MEDVARLAGVSVSTVSRALRGSDLVSPETTARVRAAADELSFAISRAASSLATGKLNRVAVLVSGSLGTWFNGTLLDSVYATLHQAGQELLIYRTLDSAERDEFFATLPARRNADALIVASLELTAAQRSRLRELGMPLVYVNQRVRGAAAVSIDDAAGAAGATRHLLSLGHRRIAFVGWAHAAGTHPSSSDRLSGYRQVMTEAGIAASAQRVITASERDEGRVGRLRTRRVASDADRIGGRVRRIGDERAGRVVPGRRTRAPVALGDRVRRARDGGEVRPQHRGAAG